MLIVNIYTVNIVYDTFWSKDSSNKNSKYKQTEKFNIYYNLQIILKYMNYF